MQSHSNGFAVDAFGHFSMGYGLLYSMLLSNEFCHLLKVEEKKKQVLQYSKCLSASQLHQQMLLPLCVVAQVVAAVVINAVAIAFFFHAIQNEQCKNGSA